MKQTIPNAVNYVIELSDIVLCILDARFIEETRNYETEAKIKEFQHKRIIYVLNKADLAGHIEQKELNKLSPNVLVSCKTRRGVNELRNKIKIIGRQMDKKPIYVGVIGYPNTGKSSIINLILGRKEIAKISPESGFTKGVQKLKLSEDVYLLDSPGIIPATERFNELVKLAKIGVKTYDRTDDPELVVHELMKLHPGLFEEFYKIDAKGGSEIILEELGRKRGILMKGGIVDADRTARVILRDWQKGRIKLL